MALQVEQDLALDWTDFVDLVGPKLVEAGLEGLDLVEIRPVIDAGPFVPKSAIGLQVLIQALTAPPAARRAHTIDRYGEDLAWRTALVIAPNIFSRHAVDESEVLVRLDIDDAAADGDPMPRTLGAHY